jgi:hypothetical protein
VESGHKECGSYALPLGVKRVSIVAALRGLHGGRFPVV